MRTANLSTVFYAPEQPPEKQDDFNRYVYNELLKIKSAIDALAAGHLDKSFAAPAKPREGDIRFADGATWNPASGKGIYYFDGTTWKLLG